MRKPTPYEDYLSDQLDTYAHFDGHGYDVPMWLVNETRAYSWLYKLYRALDPQSNGYTISKAIQGRIRNGSKARIREKTGLSPQMLRMIMDASGLLVNLDQRVLGKYNENQTIQIMNEEDRRLWKEAHKELETIVFEVPEPRTREEGEESSIVKVDSFWK